MPVTYVDKIYYNNSQYSRGYKGSELLWDKKPDFFYIENLYNGLNTLTLKKTGSPTTGSDIQWSGDLVTWTPVTYDANNEFLIGIPNQNQKIYFRSSTGFSSDVDNFFTFSATETHRAGGDLRTLLDYTDPTLNTAPSNCFRKLFLSDTAIVGTDIAILSKITAIGLSSYRQMFSGCTSLTQAPELYATTLDWYCYRDMFYGCTSLISAPQLPATTLANQCYCQMFFGCTSLTQAASLPATTLADNCYYGMFNGCTSLTEAPELPATNLATECYRLMFNDCTSLTQAPFELPATSSAESCYRAMFQNCSSLVIAPDIHCSPDSATAFSYMFHGCTSLNKIVVYSTTWDTNNTAHFTYNVASSGLFVNYNNISITTGSTSGIPTGWTSLQYDYFCVHFSADVTLQFSKTGSPSGTVQWSYNGTSWTTITSWPYSFRTEPQYHTKMYIRVTGRTNTNSSNYFRYSFHNFKVSGDIRTLLDYTNTSLDTASEYSFYKSIANVGDASELVMHRIKNLNTGCFESMFDGANALTKAPELPATNLASDCYKNMFNGCTSLTQAPELPATTLATGCYRLMFNACISLTQAPFELPATTSAESCYRAMFQSCRALEFSPDIYCSPDSTTAFNYMFFDCSSLREIRIHSTTWDTTNTTNWLQDTAASGDFYNLGGASIASGASGIPSGWTEHTTL